MSELLVTRLGGVPAEDATSLVGHVVGVFSPHLSALCDAYDTYLAGIDAASDTLRQLIDTSPTFTQYIDVLCFCVFCCVYFIVVDEVIILAQTHRN